MNEPDWISVSNDQISLLVDEYLSEVLERKGELADELSSDDKFTFRERIDSYRRIGRRKREREDIEQLLLQHGVERVDIAPRLGVDVATLSRWFNGRTASDKVEQLFVVYRDELRELRHPTEDELGIAGFCYAITEYRFVIHDLLKHPIPSMPSMSDENFCNLWAALDCAPFAAAMDEDDPLRQLELCETAVQRIYERVKDSSRFPSYSSARKKPAETLISLHQKWGLWFRLVIYSSADATKFAASKHSGHQKP